MKEKTKFNLKVIGFIALCALLGGVIGWFSHSLKGEANQEFYVTENTCVLYQPNVPRISVVNNIKPENCVYNNLTAKKIESFKFSYPVMILVEE